MVRPRKQQPDGPRELVEPARVPCHSRPPCTEVTERVGWPGFVGPAGQQHQQLDRHPDKDQARLRCQFDTGNALRNVREVLADRPPVVNHWLVEPVNASDGTLTGPTLCQPRLEH